MSQTTQSLAFSSLLPTRRHDPSLEHVRHSRGWLIDRQRFHQEAPPPYEDPADVSAEQEPIAQPGQLNKWESTVPKLAILLMIVGSRGDVQPFIALSQALVAHGHRVRIATHKVFESFVRSHGLEFFDIGGDPRELMSWLVKNPGLLPKMTSLTDGIVGRQKKMLSEILLGCSQATYMPDALTGRPFAPDTIISNPPTFAHIHLAELLGVPLHMTFCMPWTPSTAFAHPLVNVMSTNANIGWTNWCSFVVAEAVTWSGLSNVQNDFRSRVLGLPRLSGRSGPGVVNRLRIPYTYCWSPSLISKPKDWRRSTEVSGFYFLDGSTGYQPPAELDAFLRAGEAPIYIRFGSVPVSDPAAMSAIIFGAVAQAGVRAVVSVGWGGLGGVDIDPKRVFLLGDTPHDWLFKHVRAVVHHGGAGTTAIGLLNGCPTVICPFFGDQFYWAQMVEKAGAGPPGLPGKTLTTENLVEALRFVCTPESTEAAQAMGEKIRRENGIQEGVDAFHRHLPLSFMRCDILPSHVAVWWSEALCLQLSPLAAQALVQAGRIQLKDLELHRAAEYLTRKQHSDPVTGMAIALLDALMSCSTGFGLVFYKPHIGFYKMLTAAPIAVFDTLINLQEGLSNAPLLYGSSVRRADDTDIRNLSTGFIAAGKCFVFGFYDGVVGVVVEPLIAIRAPGKASIAKGVAKAVLGLALRPASGMFALLALPAKGIQRSTWRRRNKLLPAIREVRTRESEEAFALASLEQKTQALHTFRTLECRVSERRKARRNEHAWYYLGRENYEGLLPAEISDSSPAPTTGHNEVPQANPPVYDQLMSSMPSSSIKGGQR